MTTATRAVPRHKRAPRRALPIEARPALVEAKWLARLSPDRFIEWALLVMVPVLALANYAWTFESFELPKQVSLRVLLHITFAGLIGLVALRHFCNPSAGAAGPALSSLADRALRWPPLLVALAVITAWSVVTVTSVAPTVSFWGAWPRWAGWWQQAHVVSLFVLGAAAITTVTRLHRLSAVIALSAAISGAYALYQRFGQRINRPHSTFGNPNFLSDYIALSLPLTLAAAAASRSLPARVFWGLCAVLQAGAAIVTETRGVWVGLAIGVPLLAVLLVRQRGGPWLKLTVGLGVAGLMALGGLYVFRQALKPVPVLSRVVSIFEARDEAAVSRLVVWNTARQLWLDRPILGHGPDTFGTVAGRRLPPQNEAILSESYQELFDRAHNTTLDGLVAVGLAGMLTLAGTALLALWSGIRLVLRAPRPADAAEDALPAPAGIGTQIARHPLGMGLIAGLVAFVIGQQFSIESAGASSLSWLLGGVLVAAGLNVARVAPALAVPATGANGTPNSNGAGTSTGARARGPVYLPPPAWAIGGAIVLMVVVGSASAVFENRQIQGSVEFKRANGLARAERSAEAAAAYERSVEHWPFERRYWLELAFARRHNARVLTDQAATRRWLLQSVADADRAIAIDPENSLYLSKWADVAGEVAQRLNDTALAERAIQTHERAITMAPDRWVLWADAGLTYLRLNRPEKARDALARTLALYDRDWVQFARYGDALSALNDRAGARRAYQRALTMNDHAGVREALARLGPD